MSDHGTNFMNLASLIYEAGEHLPEGLYIRLFNSCKQCKDITEPVPHGKEIREREEFIDSLTATLEHEQYLRTIANKTWSDRVKKLKEQLLQLKQDELPEVRTRQKEEEWVINPKTNCLIKINGRTYIKLKKLGIL